MFLPKTELPGVMLSMPPSPSTSFSSSISVTSDSEMRDISSQSRGGEALEIKPKKRRIRQNLSHMSTEEKLNRRKMKNRVAAQSARDRRKAKMDEMDSKVARLSEERIKLIRENEKLKKMNHELEGANQDLKQRLCSIQSQKSTSDPVIKKEPVDSSSFESAELIYDPQQKNQGSLNRRAISEVTESEEEACPWMMPFVCWLVAIENLMRSSTGWKGALTSFLKENLTMIPTEVVATIIQLVQDKELSEEDRLLMLRALPPDLQRSFPNLNLSAT